MKILILADSLAMPRPQSEGDIPDECTYPSLIDRSLREKFGINAPVVIERGMRRRTIEYVLNDWQDLIEYRSPEMLVVHVGIVDCAPRVFMRLEREMVDRLRPISLRDAILRFAHDHRRRIVQFRKRVYVPAAQFRRQVTEVVERARAANIKSLIFINIVTPPQDLDLRSPGFIQNVITYNQILKECVRGDNVDLIDLDEMIRQAGGAAKLTVDGIHIDRTGHQMLAREIEDRIARLMAAQATGLATPIQVGGAN